MLKRALDFCEREFATPVAVTIAVGCAMAGDDFGACLFAFVSTRCFMLEIRSARR